MGISRKLCVETGGALLLTVLGYGLLALAPSSAGAQIEAEATVSGTPIKLSASKHYFKYKSNASFNLLGETFEYTCQIPRTVKGVPNAVYDQYCTLDNYRRDPNNSQAPPGVLDLMKSKKNNVLRLEALFNHSPGGGPKPLTSPRKVLDCEQPFPFDGSPRNANGALIPCTATPASPTNSWSLVKNDGTKMVADLDPRYFNNLEAVVRYANGLDIVVEVSLVNLWDGDWETSPFNAKNTAFVRVQNEPFCTNGTMYKPGFSNDKNFIVADNPTATGEDQVCASRLARIAQTGALTEVIKRLRKYPNVIWEIANEPDYLRPTAADLTRPQVFAWQKKMIDLILANDPGAAVNTSLHLVEIEGHYNNTAAWNDPGASIEAAHYTGLKDRATCNVPGEPYGALELRDAISGIAGAKDAMAFSFNENTVLYDPALGGGNRPNEPRRTDAAVRAEAWDFIFKRGALFNSYSIDRTTPYSQALRSQLQALWTFSTSVAQHDTITQETCNTGSTLCQIRNGGAVQNAPFSDNGGCTAAGAKLFWSALRTKDTKELDLYFHHGDNIFTSCGGTSTAPPHGYYVEISCPVTGSTTGYQFLAPGEGVDPCENPAPGARSLCLKPPNGCYSESWIDPATGNPVPIPDPAHPGQLTNSVDHEFNAGPDGNTWTSPKSPPAYAQDIVLRLRYKAASCIDPELTAAFTVSCDFLYCTFDPGASSPSYAISNYAWDWGDGTTDSTSAAAPIAHNFAASGSYPVTLTVSNLAGDVGSTTETVPVSTQPPAVSFNYACRQTVCGFDSFLQQGSGGIAFWSWDFGDGASSAYANPTHTFASGGSYSVSLQAVDVYGASTTVTRILAVTGPPEPAFTSSCAGFACGFDASGSVAGSSPIASFNWSFGDGTTGSGSAPSHTFTAPGTYPVTLTVTDTAGLSASLTLSVFVNPPVASFTISCAGLSCTFDAGASTAGSGTIASYVWDFGDGQSATGVSAVHTYATATAFTVTLEVTDTSNQHALASQPVNLDPKPVACFTWSCSQRTCAFDGRCSSDNQPIASYAWSFGDGTAGTGATASHTYAVGGPYTVTLTVADSTGQPAGASSSVAVKRPPVAVNDSAFTSLNTAVDINVLANDSDPDGDALSVTGLTSPAHGTVSINPNGTVRYVPATGYVGTDSFQYRAQDAQDVSGLATVTLNRAPIARDDAWATAQNVPANIPYSSLLANDYDPDGDTLAVSSVNASGLAGTLDCSSGTYCRFTPVPSFGGVTSFTYVASDGKGGTSQATVRIKVGIANAAPAPQDDLLETARNTPFTFTRATLLANDSDADGDVLSVTWVYPSTLTAQGTVSCSGAYYRCVYTPPAGFTGVDVLYYRASDGITTTDARIRILVRPPSPAVLDAREDQMFFTPTGVFLSYGWMTANDYAPQGGALTVVGIDTAGLAGSLDCTTFSTGCQFTRGGSDPTRFRYTVRDSLGNLDTATVILKPGNAAFNRVPAVTDDALVTRMNTPVVLSVFDLLRNDYDPDNDQLSLAPNFYTSAHGHLTCSSPVYTCTYTPTAGYTGTDSFTYTVNDGNNSVQGTFTLNVLPLAASDAQILSQSVPVSLFAGQSYAVSLRIKNVGTAAWSPVGAVCNGFRLGAANPLDNATWGSLRTDLPAPVASGGEVTLTFTITAPQTPGTYNFQRRMLQECVAWFGDLSPNLTLTVSQ